MSVVVAIFGVITRSSTSELVDKAGLTFTSSNLFVVRGGVVRGAWCVVHAARCMMREHEHGTSWFKKNNFQIRKAEIHLFGGAALEC